MGKNNKATEMTLAELIQNQVAGEIVKRAIILHTEEGPKEADVYVKVLSCSDVMGSSAVTQEDIIYHNVAKAILDDKGKEIFTVDQLKNLRAAVWSQLYNVTNEVNSLGKINP